MTSFLSDPGLPGGKPPSRPPIWSGAPRRNAPDLRAIASASLHRSRVAGAPVVMAASDRLARFAARVDDGAYRVNTARLGNLSRIVPSAGRMARLLRGTSRLIALSAETVAPPPPLEALPLRPWDGAPGAIAPAAPVRAAAVAPRPETAVAQPVQVAPPPLGASPLAPRGPDTAAIPAADQDTLDAIRALMRTETRPARPVRQKTVDPEPSPPPRILRGLEALPPLEPHVPAPPSLPFRWSAQALGLAFLALALPVGTAATVWLALRGQEIEPDA